MKRTINVGLVGFGTVGVGLVKVLKSNASVIKERLRGELQIKAIADKDIVSPRSVEVDRKILTTDVKALLNDPEIDIIVELIGGDEPAKTYILEAIKGGKHVVTANKALLAEHGEEIFEVARRGGVDVYFEGSVGGGMPIIKILKEGLVANRLHSILGIINGTANYILSRMSREGSSLQEALSEAKRLRYAEADPAMDTEGIDSAHKLAILASIGFGTKVRISDLYVEGIAGITARDIQYASQFGYSIKLLAIAKEVGDEEIEVRVHPTLLPQDHLLSSVSGIFNACYLRGDCIGEMLVYGQGAGQMPTASAVAADVVDLARNLLSGSPGRVPVIRYSSSKRIRPMEESQSRYYFRFSVVDQPGVLAEISGILGQNDISIASVIQKERKEGDIVPIVMMTHEAKEKAIRLALKKVDNLPAVKAKTMLIRVESG
ncbi:homoserine dehydrogenase [candidate division NPL-UPA2 bacterium]|nr:homoserine dehydrogenase [candidate division NPL-UPA2 bacterium]